MQAYIKAITQLKVIETPTGCKFIDFGATKMKGGWMVNKDSYIQDVLPMIQDYINYFNTLTKYGKLLERYDHLDNILLDDGSSCHIAIDSKWEEYDNVKKRLNEMENKYSYVVYHTM